MINASVVIIPLLLTHILGVSDLGKCYLHSSTSLKWEIEDTVHSSGIVADLLLPCIFQISYKAAILLNAMQSYKDDDKMATNASAYR